MRTETAGRLFENPGRTLSGPLAALPGLPDPTPASGRPRLASEPVEPGTASPPCLEPLARADPLTLPAADGPSDPSSAITCGTVLSSHFGIHHAARPMTLMNAGTSRQRITIASMKIATARPIPNRWSSRASESMNAPNTAIMTAAAAVTTPPVDARPLRTASIGRPMRIHSSRIRDTRNTS